MSKKKEVLDQIAEYSFADQVSQLITAVGGIIMRNFLGPVQTGIWSALQIILNYSSYTHLGTTTALSREIPYYSSKGDQKSADEVKDLVASFSTLTSLITAIGIVIYALLFRQTLSDAMFWGLIFVSFILLLQRVNNLMIGLLRAYKLFGLASQQIILSAIVNVFLIAIFSYQFKIYGFMWAMLLSLFFNIGFIMVKHPFQFHFLLNKKIWDLITFGFPLLIIGISESLLKSIDKIVIVRMLGFEQMGFYSVGVMLTTWLGRIPNSISIVMVPHFQEKYGTRDKAEDLKSYVDKAVFAFCRFMPILIGVGWIGTPIFVALLLPAYTEGVLPAKYLLLSSYFFALIFPFTNVLFTLKKNILIFPILVIIIGLEIAAAVLAVKLGYGIAGIAAMTTFAFMMQFALYAITAGKFIYSYLESLSNLRKVFSHFFIMLVILIVLDHLVQFNNIYLTAATQLLIFSLFSIPLLISLNRHFNLFDHLKQKFLRGK